MRLHKSISGPEGPVSPCGRAHSKRISICIHLVNVNITPNDNKIGYENCITQDSKTNKLELLQFTMSY